MQAHKREGKLITYDTLSRKLTHICIIYNQSVTCWHENHCLSATQSGMQDFSTSRLYFTVLFQGDDDLYLNYQALKCSQWHPLVFVSKFLCAEWHCYAPIQHVDVFFRLIQRVWLKISTGVSEHYLPIKSVNKLWLDLIVYREDLI